LSAADSLRVAKHSWNSLDLLLSQPVSSIERIAEEVGEGADPAAIWMDLVLVTGSHYAFAVDRVLLDPAGKGLPPGLNVPKLSLLTDTVERESPPVAVVPTLMFINYLSVLVSMYFLRVTSALPQWGPRGELEWVAHDSASALFRKTLVAPDKARLLGEYLTASALQLMAQAYKAVSVFNRDHPPGPFSSMRIGELSLLAKRDQRLLDRYGEKHVEQVFEQQLALIFQSLGFYVVSTRRGERRVDLVCISADPTEPLTALIEAKTTKAAYALPTKDERALREYVDEVRRSLRTLPPLRYVLIVAPRPASTLQGKLARLEADCGIPIRFCSAQALASLRERLPGMAPMRVLTESILTGSHVLPDDMGEGAIARYMSEQDAHSHFVGAMFGLRADEETPESEPA
jgi:hypothetical protein